MHRTPLYDWHLARGGRMVDFAGWSMPVLYSSIIEEHQAVRQAAGLFDISHMGRLRLEGAEVASFVENLVTCPIASLAIGQIRYGLVTNERGGVLDDILVYNVDEACIDLVVNASNREKILDWIDRHRGGGDIDVVDQTFGSAMLALQGPQAYPWLAPHAAAVAELRYYRFVDSEIFGMPVRLSRTGYTGEDGFEFIVPADRAVELVYKLLALAPHREDPRVLPCGLGCRDTLRLEAGMPLYGHELSETIDPITAGLGFAVGKKKTFIGSEPIGQIRAAGAERSRIGLRLEGRRIAREGAAIFAGDEEVGVVTSGTFSPTLEASIAMAYVDADHARADIKLDVDLKGKRIAARVVELPFYRRPSDE